MRKPPALTFEPGNRDEFEARVALLRHERDQARAAIDEILEGLCPNCLARALQRKRPP